MGRFSGERVDVESNWNPQYNAKERGGNVGPKSGPEPMESQHKLLGYQLNVARR